ncbi:MAG: ankyrin repeat domain-containing protein [Synoicihabitans sp.]
MRRWAIVAACLWVAPLGAEELPLPDAVEQQKFALAYELIGDGVAIDQVQSDGTTALQWACYLGEEDMALALLEAGASPTLANRYGVTPLYLACFNGSDRVVAALMEAGVDPNSLRKNGETALMTAARTGQLKTVQVLVEAGADMETKLPRRGQTALMWATAEGHLTVVEYLMEQGADFKSAVPSGFTPLMFAVREGHSALVDLFLRKGENPNATIQPTGNQGYKPPKKGTSPLILAIENGHFELGKELLEAGADPDDQRSGFAPLHTLTWVRRPDLGDNAAGDPVPIGKGRLTSMDMAEVLVEYGADVNLALTSGNRRGKGGGHLPNLGNTPFILACHTGDVELAKFLLAEGADPFKRNADGTSPILVAAGLGNHAPEEEAGDEDDALALLEILLDLGADINDTDSNGETVMHGAAYKNFPRVAWFLYKRGADIEIWNDFNDRGWTPLDIADGYRPGNFKPSAATSEAIHGIMLAAGVEPRTDHRVLQSQY